MLLLKEKLTLTSSFLQAAKNLYLTAFPENERLPWWYLFLSSFRKGICFYAIHCESKFCGILYTVSGSEALLIVYVAVAPELRSQGAGGKFIELIKQQYPDHAVYLLMESCDGINDPADLRIRRQRFYFRNGFSDTLWRYNSDGVRYDLLCNNEKFNIAEYKKLMNKLLIFYPKGEYFKID